MTKLPAQPDWLRADVLKSAREIGVDREKNILRGFIVAEEGPFRTEGRGEFDRDALRSIVRLMRAEPQGLKSRFAHPTLTSDGLGTFLGRARNPWREKVMRANEDGSPRELEAVRADLHLSDSAFEDNPNGNLGKYVMELASEDSEAMGASLVIRANEEYRINSKGRPEVDEDGKELPPLWRPESLHAIDVVDTGDATRAFLSVDGLPDELVRRGAALLDRQFDGSSREAIEARCKAWLERYLDVRFNTPEEQTRAANAARKVFLDKLSPDA